MVGLGARAGGSHLRLPVPGTRTRLFPQEDLVFSCKPARILGRPRRIRERLCTMRQTSENTFSRSCSTSVTLVLTLVTTSVTTSVNNSGTTSVNTNH